MKKKKKKKEKFKSVLQDDNAVWWGVLVAFVIALGALLRSKGFFG